MLLRVAAVIAPALAVDAEAMSKPLLFREVALMLLPLVPCRLPALLSVLALTFKVPSASMVPLLLTLTLAAPAMSSNCKVFLDSASVSAQAQVARSRNGCRS